jgi:hypothetical protein
VAQQLQAQNEAIKGTGAGKGEEETPFPELSEPHLVLASPAGIESTTAGSTHQHSTKHHAITAGGHGGQELAGDTIGDEAHRQRKFSFCLFHPPKAICGQGNVGILREGRKADLTPHALKIIRSIEFLPDEPPPALTIHPPPAK